MAANTVNPDGSYVKSELHAHIYTIEFHHPHGNALTSVMLGDLTHEIGHAAHSVDAHVILLRSSGTAFCGGASFTELLQVQTEAEGTHFFSGVANLILAMRHCSKFIIACVHGKCVGGGVGIVAAADYAVALEGADVKLSELSIGIGPFVVGPAIERKTGSSAFSQLAIDAGNWRNADWARRKGIYAELHPNMESMEESVARLSDSLAHYSYEAMAETKKMLWHDTEHWEQLLSESAAISGRLITGDSAKKFLDKYREGNTVPK